MTFAFLSTVKHYDHGIYFFKTSLCPVDKIKERISKKVQFNMTNDNSQNQIKKKLGAEKIFFQGPPSSSELLVPTLSILTVVGIIPFLATLSRQFWVRYTITNRRISVDSGFQGKNHVEIVYRDIKKISHITRFGGLTADIVIILKDNARLELRSLPEWEKNLQYINNIISLNED
jgi:hypothetical protein